MARNAKPGTTDGRVAAARSNLAREHEHLLGGQARRRWTGFLGGGEVSLASQVL